MSARKRKLRLDDDDSMSSSNMASRTSNQKKTSKTIVRRYYTLIFLGFMIFGYVAIANDLKPFHLGGKAIDSVAFSLNFQKPFYVVIIDAGSTGSRVLAFSFHTSIINGNLVLDSELFHQEKPGLSSYADNPIEGMKSLQILVDKAKSVIPQSEWNYTPLFMKATAGLRLLPGHKANDILEVTRNFLKTSGFHLNDKSISIMEGVDEGIFSWFTVNFLLDRFNQHSSRSTVAALDLGGGSTQVTFAPDEENVKELNDNIYNISALNHNMSIYTHSYLGMGLMAARKGILVPESAAKNENGIIEIRSECINPFIKTTWNYGGQEYHIMGPVKGATKVFKNQNYASGEDKRPIVKFQDCLKLVENYTSTIKNKPIGLNKHEIYAFSYYFDRATEIGLIDPFQGGTITVEALHKAVLETCEYVNTEQPFTCLDLTFIYSLLKNTFGLEPKTKLNLYKKISGHELSWALGSAFNVLQSEL
ncbi:ectonucleoside triphosphate diphosphohydrolase 5 isoform X1 [Leptopilina boulardi]|uniref:ectonucleoside triphosphate diphosphohydrolase 5 isoform X1 n=1 Tax=Leptopilina boulardi TaxID=63433 RepID=UPI0021F694D8|nr:ectonucleoside triphosphate diphosphohydrolase 5 isoform X1 [Leptopilina boulardi]